MPCGRRHVQRRIPPYFCVIAASWSVGLFDGEAGPSGGATASSAASAGHSLAHSAEPVTASGVFTSVAAPPVVNLEHDLHTECTCTRHASAALSGAPLGRQQRRLPASDLSPPLYSFRLLKQIVRSLKVSMRWRWPSMWWRRQVDACGDGSGVWRRELGEGGSGSR